MSDTPRNPAPGSSNTAEYIVVACLFAGLAGTLAYGMYVSRPARPDVPVNVAAAPAAPAAVPAKPDAQPVQGAADGAAFTPPGARDIPDTPMGEWIRRGEAIFLRTPANAVGFSGNTLNCVNCHLDAGRLKGAAPMWGAYPLYPAYRKKTNHVDTFAERVRGCFMYSMNGKAPDDGHDILVALEAYAYWMAQKAPTGEKLPGAGFTKVGKAAQEPSFERGAKVYEAKCALCHGAQGRATTQGYFPRLAGKPSGYLFNQLQSFRDGRRHHALMAGLLRNMSDDYLREIAGYFAALDVPYPAPGPSGLNAEQQARAERLILQGDPARKVPACTACHGPSMAGREPAVPGLLGLPRDYLVGQLGAWRNGLRRAHAPDCMADVAKALSTDDIAVVASWLAAKPAGAHPEPPSTTPLPVQCGGLAR